MTPSPGDRAARRGCRFAAGWLVAALLSLAGCGSDPSPAQFAGAAMGTSWHVSVTGADDDGSRAEVTAIVARVLEDAERHLSAYDENSELARLNADPSTDWQDVSPTLFAVLRDARDASELTGGTFDVTVAPLLALWGFDAAAPGATAPFDPPDAARVAAVLRSVGYRRLELRKTPRPAVRRLVPGMRLTVDGIAPGHAVDQIADELLAHGWRDFIVEIGGEVRAHGQRPEGGPWRIAVEAPLAAAREPLAGVRLRDAAISTSGDYRDVRVDSRGGRHSHTIDPRNGRTVTGRLTSVTVIDQRAARADACATALMVMGTEAGLAWAKELRVPVLFVERTDTPGQWRLVESPAFREWRE